MPLVTLSTNVQLLSEDAKKAFTSDFSKFCAKTIGKDEKFFNINVSFNPCLMFGGSFEPAIMLHVISVGNVNPNNSKTWSKEFSDYFADQLGVPVGRGLMSFTDPGPAFVGANGTTVEALQAQ